MLTGMGVEHVPTAETKERVRLYARVGAPHEHIAESIDIGVDALRDHYDEILRTAETEVLVAVKGKLVEKAMAGDITAIIVYLKAKSRRFNWLGFGPDPEAQGASVTIQVDAAQAISQLFTSLKRDGDAPHARIIEQAPKED